MTNQNSTDQKMSDAKSEVRRDDLRGWLKKKAEIKVLADTWPLKTTFGRGHHSGTRRWKPSTEIMYFKGQRSVGLLRVNMQRKQVELVHFYIFTFTFLTEREIWHEGDKTSATVCLSVTFFLSHSCCPSLSLAYLTSLWKGGATASSRVNPSWAKPITCPPFVVPQTGLGICTRT